ncbi:NAD(P)-dependent oxidoreductase [Terasakiella sp. SH-1]|uniref:NAD-dependent epimerase/dehydratase family protein n=1 Tax=Terasakiella sp. SH-1 TaxID=2560057 RepID=UPI0014305C4E|nr:NAD(P)-dependent oxidoreductase [Terasakiella sp. SH-1]
MFLDIETEDLETIVKRSPDLWEALAGKSLFITGGTGFFGKWVLASVLYANAQYGFDIKLCVMTRNAEAFKVQFPEADHPNIRFYVGDIRHKIFPQERFDYVLHMATDSKFDDPKEHMGLMDGILTGTQRVLDFAVHSAQAEKFLYVSSGAVYGPLADGEVKTPEHHPIAPAPHEPRALIANAKRMAEQMCTLYHHQFDLDVKIARCFAFVGPHLPMDAYFAIGNFIRDGLEGEGIHIAGDGTPVRSYMYAGDLISWLLEILINGETNTPYNVGSDQPVSIKELAEQVAESLAGNQTVSIAKQAVKKPDLNCYVPNVDKAKEALSVDNWTGLGQGIEKTARWYQAYGQKHTVAPVRVEKKRFVMDIDGVIATITPGNDYRLCEPITHNIAALNRLYDAGHEIILLTARGYVTAIDWRETTEKQMEKWGVKYHELHLGKPNADYYVDDKMLSLEMFRDMGR